MNLLLLEISERSRQQKNDNRMKGAELIVRFFALQAGWNTYVKPLSSFLDSFVSQNRSLTSQQVAVLRAKFNESKDLCVRYFGQGAYKIYNVEQGKFVAFNSAIYDAQMVGISESGNPDLLSGKCGPARVLREASI